MSHQLKFITPPAFARKYGVAAETVREWIEKGVLQAMNTGNASRPRWKIRCDWEEAFVQSRMNRPTPEPKRRKRKSQGDVIEFFS